MPLSQVKPQQYQQQLDAKAKRIRQQFTQFSPPALEVYDSPPLHYRMRAEFRIWHQEDDSFYVMFNPQDPKSPHRIDEFPIGSESINRLMKAVMARVKTSEQLRRRLFQVEFLTTLSNEALVTLIYHKKLDDQWQLEAEQLSKDIGAKIIGRSKKQKRVLNDDFVTEQLEVAGKYYAYQQVESSFTQPNAQVNQKMLSWALEHSRGHGGDLVELYCGNGNFTAVLAQNFQRVLATEISKTSVKSALLNFEMNAINNVDVIRMSSEEFSSALKGEREFRRLRDLDLTSYDFSTVLVDPPRAGLDEGTIELVSRFEHILYISCNPDTLQSNLETITKTHTIEHFAIFDQFPYTHHIECGVVLKRLANESQPKTE